MARNCTCGGGADGTRLRPTGALVRETPADVVTAISDTITTELTSRWDGTGAPLQAMIAIVTARRPATS